MVLGENIQGYQQEGNFVALRAGNLWLLLKQSEVQSAEQFVMLPNTEQIGGVGGLFVSTEMTKTGEERSYYVALSEHLNLLPQLQKERFLITKLKGSQLHWCWDEVKVLPHRDLSEIAVPPVLRTPETEVDTIAFFDDKQGFVFSVERLLKILPQDIKRIVD